MCFLFYTGNFKNGLPVTCCSFSVTFVPRSYVTSWRSQGNGENSAKLCDFCCHENAGIMKSA